MSDTLARRHPLERFLNERPSGDRAGDAHVLIRPDLDYVSVRGNPDDHVLMDKLKAAVGFDLPLEANTFRDDGIRCYWLGPDEWLFVSAPGSNLLATLESVSPGLHASVNKQSGGMLTLELGGVAAADILSKGCTLNLTPDVFRAEQCAQTLLAKSNILIARGSGENSFTLVVRRSFAEYVALWLAHAGKDVAISFAVLG